MNKSFEDILDACLDRITQKGASVEQCMESYPELANELEPLLRAALSVKEASAVEARPEFRQAAKSRLLSALAAKEAKKGRQGLPLWSWHRRWAMAVTVILALVIMGASTVGASTNSLPGDLLYPVKTTAEKAQAFFTFGNEAKANLHMKFAERRVTEIESLIERKNSIPRAVLTVMNTEIDRALDLVNENGSLKKEAIARLVQLTTVQKTVLVRMLENAPPEAKMRIQDALRRSEVAHERAVDIKERVLRPRNLRVPPSRSNPVPLEGGILPRDVGRDLELAPPGSNTAPPEWDTSPQADDRDLEISPLGDKTMPLEGGILPESRGSRGLEMFPWGNNTMPLEGDILPESRGSRGLETLPWGNNTMPLEEGILPESRDSRDLETFPLDNNTIPLEEGILPESSGRGLEIFPSGDDPMLLEGDSLPQSSYRVADSPPLSP